MSDVQNEAPPRSAGAVPANEGAGHARGARMRAARLVGALAIGALALVAILAALDPWSAARPLQLARGSGWVACGALLIALAATPLARLVRTLSTRARSAQAWVIPAPVLRRAFGMGAAWLGAAHALAALLGPLDGEPRALLQTSQLLAGASALAVLALLLLTSFERVIQALRLREWKALHRLAYVAALLVAQHVLLAPFPRRALALGLLAAVLGLLAVRALRVRR